MSFYMKIFKNKFTWSNLRGFVAQGEIGKVCRLQKSLYGLKQSPRAWFGKCNQAIETFGTQKSKYYHSVFFKNFSSSIILLKVYVDDIVITESDSKGILSLKSLNHNQFFCYLNKNMYLICYMRQGN